MIELRRYSPNGPLTYHTVKEIRKTPCNMFYVLADGNVVNVKNPAYGIWRYSVNDYEIIEEIRAVQDGHTNTGSVFESEMKSMMPSVIEAVENYKKDTDMNKTVALHDLLQEEENKLVRKEAKRLKKKFHKSFGYDDSYEGGDVITVRYSFDDSLDSVVYTMALLKTDVGWFTTGQATLRGARTFEDFLMYFYGSDKIIIRSVQPLRVSTLGQRVTG